MTGDSRRAVWGIGNGGRVGIEMLDHVWVSSSVIIVTVRASLTVALKLQYCLNLDNISQNPSQHIRHPVIQTNILLQ
jgi:hypothetical protein